LALMLRSQGIPARVVVGFHPEEYNALGGYYQVRQRHAHAWTEAYLEPGDVALELPPGSDVGANGGWLRLDPTPGSDVDRSRQVQRGLVEVATDALDYASVVWRDYILGLTATRQRETIYDPVAERADLEGWSQWMQRFSLQRGELARQIRSWLFHPWSLGVLGLLAALAVGWYVWGRRAQRLPLPAGRRGSPWTNLWTGYNGQRGGAGTDREVAFYRRFETMLARWGALRAPGQTPQEFVGEVRQRLALLPDATPPWDRLAERIVAAFYRVRFGRGELAAEEASELEHALESLELQLATPSGVKA
jgi:hypothetical protein